MAEQEPPEELRQLVEKMRTGYLDSELAIATALAQADEPLDVDALVEETGYTKRTVSKRIDSLKERLGGAPLIQRHDDAVTIHPRLAMALRRAEASSTN